VGMNADIKAQWVAALRSGEYKQGRDLLHYKDDLSNEHMCCLGVLSHLAVKAGACSRYFDDEQGEYVYGSGAVAHLPREVVEWASLDDDSPSVERDLLVNINDGGASFEEIADMIERDL
jgi:hypothetical protein